MQIETTILERSRYNIYREIVPCPKYEGMKVPARVEHPYGIGLTHFVASPLEPEEQWKVLASVCGLQEGVKAMSCLKDCSFLSPLFTVQCPDPRIIQIMRAARER